MGKNEGAITQTHYERTVENVPLIPRGLSESKSTDDISLSVYQSESDDSEDNNELFRKEWLHSPEETKIPIFVVTIKAVSCFSMLISIVLGTASMVISYECSSDAAFGFAWDCIIDIASSIVVLWRFSKFHGGLSEDESETITLVVLGTLFLASCAAILAHTVPNFVNTIWLQMTGESRYVEEEMGEIELCEEEYGIFIAAVSMAAFTVVTAILLYIGIVHKSRSIKSDGIIALVTVVTSFIWLVSMTMEQFFPSSWYLEDPVSIFLATFCLFYGLWLVSELVALLRKRRSVS